MTEHRSVDAPFEIRVGAQLFRWEPPDTGYVTYSGDLDGPTVTAFTGEVSKFTSRQPRVFTIVDVSKVGRVNADARKASARGGKDVPMRGIAIVGASAHLRIISSLVSRAMDALFRDIETPTRFFQTEAEARAWIAERKHALDAK